MDRRSFVTAVGVGTLAGVTGCIQGVVGTGIEPAEDPYRNVTTNESGSDRTLQGEAVLPKATFASRSYKPESRTGFSIRYQTESGNVVDVLTMRREEFQNYKEGNEAVFLAEVSQMDAASGDLNGVLEPGDYVLVFDNTTWGNGTPQGEETVSFTVTIGN